MLKLYHGSNVAVEKPKLFPHVRALDFGAGFYLTSSYEQASRWSKTTVRRREVGKATVSVYEIDEKNLAKMAFLKFEGANADWLKFVSSNRKNIPISQEWDVISGPVANDNTMPVLNLYLKGDYDEDEALKRLLPQKLKDQYVFKTEKALSMLKFVEVILL